MEYYTNYFSRICDKLLIKPTYERRGLLWLMTLGCSPSWRGRLGSRSASAFSQEAESVNTGTQRLSAFDSKQDSSCGMVLPTIRIILTSINVIHNIPHGNTHRFVAIRVVGNQVNSEDHCHKYPFLFHCTPNLCIYKLCK